MKVHRFIGKFNLRKGKLVIADKEFLNQMRKVLRLSEGEAIILGDGNMNEASATISGYGNDSVEVDITEIRENTNEPQGKVILYCAILKKENFELVVQKATEIGIKKIVPVISERTIKLELRRDRMEKIIREAAEQSGRGIVPVLHEPVDFGNAVKMAKDNSANYFFDISGDSFENCNLSIDNCAVGVWTGPEGGWDETEIKMAKEKGFKIINLGPLTLRAETAAIVASSLVLIHN